MPTNPTARAAQYVGGLLWRTGKKTATTALALAWGWLKTTGLTLARENPLKTGLLAAIVHALAASPPGILAAIGVLLKSIAVALIVALCLAPKRAGGLHDPHS